MLKRNIAATNIKFEKFLRAGDCLLAEESLAIGDASYGIFLFDELFISTPLIFRVFAWY